MEQTDFPKHGPNLHCFLELSHLPKPQYIIIYSDSNSISNKGCKYLSKARFPNVLRIILCIFLINSADNKLDDSGVLHVSKTSWSTLRSICFGISFLTKGATASRRQECAGWPVLSGREFKQFLYVPLDPKKTITVWRKKTHWPWYR